MSDQLFHAANMDCPAENGQNYIGFWRGKRGLCSKQNGPNHLASSKHGLSSNRMALVTSGLWSLSNFSCGALLSNPTPHTSKGTVLEQETARLSLRCCYCFNLRSTARITSGVAINRRTQQ